ncbi:MAG: DegQ family serine endoprotease [Neomegalonema sp.]|nr:DegQ family serine endoprotease [Neomegalonema sp.]
MTALFARFRRSGVQHALIAAATVATLAAPLSLAPTTAQARSVPGSFADLAERLSPAVVNISTSQTVSAPNRRSPFPPGSPFEEFFKDFFDREGAGPNNSPRKVQSLGSGFVIDAEGYVVTNNHVIEGADEIDVNFPNGDTFPAKLIGTDPKTDIALLKIQEDRTFPHVPFADSDKARVGDWVVAIGNPFGLGGSVSAGIISARNRNINAGPYDNFIQTDAAINRGNSGGPLFNMDGEVVGVNTAIISPSGGSIGIGFSVPANLAKNVIAQLREFGQTRRGWLGVQIQEIDDSMAEAIGLDRARGALVAGVDNDGPAKAGGIRSGDVILSFDGREVKAMRDLPRLVADTEVGRAVEVEVLRNGETRNLTVEIALLAEQTAAADERNAPEIAQGSGSIQALGLVIEPLNRENRERFGIDSDLEGVVVTEVDGASSAAERGIRPGDVIAEVGQKAVRAPAEVQDLIELEQGAGKKSVLLMLNRGGSVRFVAVDFEN